MGAVNATKPEPRPGTGRLPAAQWPRLRSPSAGARVRSRQGTRFHMPQLQIVHPLLRPGLAKSIRTGEGGRNMGNLGSPQEGRPRPVWLWCGCAGSPRTGAIPLHAQVSNCGLTEALMPGKSPLNPGRTPWGSPKIL